MVYALIRGFGYSPAGALKHRQSGENGGYFARGILQGVNLSCIRVNLFYLGL